MNKDFLQDYADVLLPADIQKILHVGRNSVYRYYQTELYVLYA